MKITIDEYLKKINKTRFWLSSTTGIQYPNICRLCNNKTSSIKFDTLEAICRALNCYPSDILFLESENSK